MGYYTDYSLDVREIKDQNQFDDLVMELKKLDLVRSVFDEGRYNSDRHDAYFSCYEEAKWYNHAKDMLHISEKFPNMYFELEGNGEEFGDFWREYWHDGECEACRGEIVYEQPKKIPWQELGAF